MIKIAAMSKLQGLSRSFILTMAVGILGILPCGSVMSNVVPDAVTKDDSELIVSRLKESLNSHGLISVEQHTGRLLFNPTLEKLHSMTLKQKFLLPAMIVNQKQGLQMVTELPFACFLISGGDIASDNYKGFRQYETARYIRDVKNFAVSRALICQAVGVTAARAWGRTLDLNLDDDPFVFEEHVSISGEHFYYFLNIDGLFEMYM